MINPNIIAEAFYVVCIQEIRKDPHVGRVILDAPDTFIIDEIAHLGISSPEQAVLWAREVTIINDMLPNIT